MLRQDPLRRHAHLLRARVGKERPGPKARHVYGDGKHIRADTILDHGRKAKQEGLETPAFARTRLHLVHLGLGLRRLEENDGLRANRKRMSSCELLLPQGRMKDKGWIRPEPTFARKPISTCPTCIDLQDLKLW